MPVSSCTLLDLPRFTNGEGNLSFVENNKHIPFAMQRIYYLYDVPSVGRRGMHAHKELQQILIAISGSFDVLLDDGISKKSFTLSSPSQGLYICPMIWRELDHFSPNAVCLVLASAPYDEQDYFRHYDDFLRSVQEKQ